MRFLTLPAALPLTGMSLATHTDAQSFGIHCAGLRHYVIHGGNYYGSLGSSHRDGCYTNFRAGGRCGSHRY